MRQVKYTCGLEQGGRSPHYYIFEGLWTHDAEQKLKCLTPIVRRHVTTGILPGLEEFRQRASLPRPSIHPSINPQVTIRGVNAMDFSFQLDIVGEITRNMSVASMLSVPDDGPSGGSTSSVRTHRDIQSITKAKDSWSCSPTCGSGGHCGHGSLQARDADNGLRFLMQRQSDATCCNMLQHDCARPVIIAIAITGRPTQSKAIKVRVRPYNPTPWDRVQSYGMMMPASAYPDNTERMATRWASMPAFHPPPLRSVLDSSRS